MSDKPDNDDYIDIGGERLRVFSRAHLEVQNPYAALSDERLNQQFDRYVSEVGDRTPGIMKLMQRALKEGTVFDGKDLGDSLTRVAIREGHMYGLGSSPQVSTESYLLWAGAARLMERAGYGIDEPVRKPSKGTEPPKSAPPRGLRPGG